MDEAYKCTVRTPWWRPPVVGSPGLFFTYLSHRDPPRHPRTAEPPGVTGVDRPSDVLEASRFFEDVVEYVTDRSPIKEHVEVRRRRPPEPIGGLPEEEDPAYDADE